MFHHANQCRVQDAGVLTEGIVHVNLHSKQGPKRVKPETVSQERGDEREDISNGKSTHQQ